MLYVHTVLAFLLFPVTIIFMQKFSAELRFKDVSLVLTRTLMIEKIPLNMSRSFEANTLVNLINEGNHNMFDVMEEV